MAISPPSDIVLDVARAIEPTTLEAARAQLARRAGSVALPGPAGTFSLEEAVGAAGTGATRAPTPDAEGTSFKRFEAVVLQTFIQNMLPKDAAAVYGKGMAGDMWKSLMAEKMAQVMAERGGIGIADRMLGGRYGAAGPAAAATPPTEMPAPSAAADPSAEKTAALLEAMQRGPSAAPRSDPAE